MSDHISHNENEEQKLQESAVIKSPKKRTIKFGSDKKRLILLALVVLAIPLTVGLALVSQEMRGRAGGGLPLASVAIHPGSINSNIDYSKNPVGLSVLGYDTQGNPITNSGIYYDWSISSIDTVGTLTKNQGVTSEFIPFKAGCGVLTVTAHYGGESLTKSAMIQVGDKNGTPKCSTDEQTGINWNTNEVSLIAKNFYIDINGYKFTNPTLDNVTSSQVTYGNDGYYRTNIEGRWIENGVDMKMRMSFKYKPGDFWRLEKVETYDGKAPGGGLIDYKPVEVMNSLGDSYINGSLDFFDNGQYIGTKARIHFDSVNIKPFLSMLTPTPIKDDCVRVKPFITNIEPLDGKRTINSGQTTFYKFWVRNDNSNFCPDVKYRMVVNNKNQYITITHEDDFILKSGESRDTIVKATVKGGAPVSSNQINVAVWDVNNLSKPESNINVNLTISDLITPIYKKVTLNPNADSFVGSTTPNKNYGTTSNLKNDLKPDEISYMRFNLSTLANKNIKSAKLILWTSDPTNSTLNLRNADDSDWSENGITYNNRPKLISTITSFNAKSKDKSVTIDVTGRIKSKKGARTTFGIKAIADDSGAFYSRNAIDASKRPQLVVEYY